MTLTGYPCPFCGSSLVHCKKILPGQSPIYPIPCYYTCDRCGYEEEAPPLSQRDLRKIIRDHFRKQREGDE